jgi:hypothetical protein
MSAGMTKNQAIKTQFSTAIAAYCGTLIGLLGMEQMKQIIGYDLMVPFTAGGFIYLAAVTILPSLLEEKRGLIVRILHVMSFIVGIVFMYYVSVLEHSNGCYSHSHEHHDHPDHHDNGHHHHETHDHMDHHSQSHNHGHVHDHHHGEF